MNSFLFRQIDNSALIIFRVLFGLLCFLESIGAIFSGWVKRNFIDPEFTFSFIGFEWLQPLPGNWMYVYYAVMGVLGVLIMIGYKYRISTLTFAIMWTATYLMQKTSYNNHYYLLFLLSFIMFFLPANRYLSVDSKLNPKIRSINMPQWVKFILIAQMIIVYTYGAIAKLYPDWLDTTFFELLMKGKKDYVLIGNLLQKKWLHYFLAYGGILFDGLIIPLLLFRQTRMFAFCASIFFHLFNSLVFQIGIFPYLSLGFTLFFFDARTIRNIFLKNKELYTKSEIITPKHHTVIKGVLIVYLCIQVALPLRHWFIKDDVLWTEEGHRLSWRMMLRSKTGIINFNVIDKNTQQTIFIDLDKKLTPKQKRVMASKPDLIWQMAQHIKKEYSQKNQQVAVFVNSRISVNGRPYQQFIDPKMDLADVGWNYFKHASWILPSKLD